MVGIVIILPLEMLKALGDATSKSSEGQSLAGYGKCAVFYDRRIFHNPKVRIK
jgi:hypothetical protein